MKFVFFGYDFMMPAVRRLMADGHELAGVFSFPCDGVFNFNQELLALAAELRIPVSVEKPAVADIDHFISRGVTCFFCAGYIYKIPPIDEAKAYGINLHPSLLPKGRGLMPTPHIIISHPEASGFTIHKLSPAFDAGDILYQEKLPLSERETVEMLSVRTAMRAPEAISRVMADLPALWKKAKVQNEKDAIHFPPPDAAMRMLQWDKGIAHIDRTARAFGRYGSLAQFDQAGWIVYSLDVWKETHEFWPGDVVHATPREIIVAASDGFVCIKEFQKIQN